MHLYKLLPLKGNKEFQKIIKYGKKFSEKDAWASIMLNVNSSNQTDNLKSFYNRRTIYFAVSISKKTAKKAVVRNRVKRLLRESIRRLFIENEDYSLAFDYILISWKAAPTHPKLINLEDVLPVIRNIFLKAYNYYNRNLFNDKNYYHTDKNI